MIILEGATETKPATPSVGGIELRAANHTDCQSFVVDRQEKVAIGMLLPSHQNRCRTSLVHLRRSDEEGTVGSLVWSS